ncbi:MAG: S8 family serine peptidase [Pseudomonadota bacterium]
MTTAARPAWRAAWRALAHALLALLALPLVLALAACATPGAAPSAEGADTAMQADSSRYIVLAVDNPQTPPAGHAGSSLGGYGPAPRYLQGQRAASQLADIARTHGLREVAGWPIVALGWHCVVFELPASGPTRETLLATLSRDARVQLAQPLQEFETLAATSAGATPATATSADRIGLAYNDPYVHLQRGFADLAAAQAHRLSAGAGVRVAVVDTGAATGHPDLQGRVAAVRDFIGTRPDGTGFDTDRHGTQVAGVIAAAGNNHQGIVGIAPLALLDLHKACWQREGAQPGAPARCNSFTLAQALAAVLGSDARIVNLSLGGPADPLLDRLLAVLLQQGRIVVGALPPSGQREGFPTGTPGVIAVANAAAPLAAGVDAVLAPGQDVLTLQPGGSYDYASGSSIAAAHVSGVAALLLSADPRLDPARLRMLLGPGGAAAPLNANTALDALQRPGASTARR